MTLIRMKCNDCDGTGMRRLTMSQVDPMMNLPGGALREHKDGTISAAWPAVPPDSFNWSPVVAYRFRCRACDGTGTVAREMFHEETAATNG